MKDKLTMLERRAEHIARICFIIALFTFCAMVTTNWFHPELLDEVAWLCCGGGLLPMFGWWLGLQDACKRLKEVI